MWKRERSRNVKWFLVNNSSYLARSKNGKYLYSIADEGVAVFAIHPDGDLEYINKVDIDGMRGCYLSVDVTGKYLFVAGYHDGKGDGGSYTPGRQAGECHGRYLPQGNRQCGRTQFPSSMSAASFRPRDDNYVCG